jgi:hypothetical protein
MFAPFATSMNVAYLPGPPEPRPVSLAPGDRARPGDALRNVQRIALVEIAPAPDAEAPRLLVAVMKMLPEPLTTARTSFATSRVNCTVPEPLTVRSSRVAVPLPVSAPLPGKVTLRPSVSMPLMAMLPLPVSVNALSVGTWTSTLIGLFVVKLPGVFRDDELARLHLGRDAVEEVVIGPHDDGLLLADANHDVVAPCEFDAVERGHITGCVAATPDPAVIELDEPRTRRSGTATQPPVRR